MLDPSCQADHPCWEHWQSTPRVMERAISLALSLVRLRAQSGGRTVEELQDVQRATWLAISLINRQWREMVRPPFNFPPQAQEEAPVEPSAVRRAVPSLDDL